MTAMNPWQSPISTRSQRAQLPKSGAVMFVLRVLASAFSKTSAAERPASLNFAVGAALYQQVQQLFSTASPGQLAIEAATVATLIGVLNLRRWALVLYVAALFFDASALSVSFRLVIATLALLHTRRFRW